MKRKLRLAMVGAAWILAGCAHQISEADWHSFGDRTPSHDLRVCAGWDKNDWMVVAGRNEVFAVPESWGGELEEPLPFGWPEENGPLGARRVLRVDNGYLVGFDGGEFGGSLWWASGDGKRFHRVMIGDVDGLIDVGAQVVVLDGLAHLGDSVGEAIFLKRGPGGGWDVDTIVELDGAPMDFLPDGESILVATTASLSRVNPNRTVSVLYRFGEGINQVASLARTKSGVVYVGMRRFVVRIELGVRGAAATWFLPVSCEPKDIKFFNCDCKDAPR